MKELLPADTNNTITTHYFPLDEVGKPIYSSQQELRAILDSNPKKEWIKVNKYSDNSAYVPIRIVEQLLNKIFLFWQIEHHGEPQIIGNSIVANCHIKVFNPFLNEWISYAGTGAVPIQVQKESHPTDWTKLFPSAIHKNAPSALSFALSNAAKKIGRIFGSHVNSDPKETI